MKKIDLIIPAYNASATIFSALSSVAIQKCSKEVHICIVDDASSDSEKLLRCVRNFRKELDVEIITLEENVGPGRARQVGIDSTNSEYVAFLDADDMLHDAFSLIALLGESEKSGASLVTSDFVEELVSREGISIHQKDLTWLFSKLYRRKYLDFHEIRFNPECSYANEDSGFNTIVNLLAEPQEIRYVPRPTYVWSGRKDSITRKDNRVYAFSDGFAGYLKNQSYAYEHVMKRRHQEDKLKQQLLSSFLSCYSYSVECMLSQDHVNLLPELMKTSQDYYFKYHDLIHSMLPTPEFLEAYRRVLAEKVILPVTFYDFLTALDDKNVSLVDSLMEQHIALLNS